VLGRLRFLVCATSRFIGELLPPGQMDSGSHCVVIREKGGRGDVSRRQSARRHSCAREFVRVIGCSIARHDMGIDMTRS